MIDGGCAKRNQIRITAHETDIAAILHYLNDVARKQSAFAIFTCRPMQHCAAFEVPAAIDWREVIPERQSSSFPKLNSRALTHNPFAIGGVQQNLRIETLGPFDHRCVVMRMRYRDGADPAARVDFCDCSIV